MYDLCKIRKYMSHISCRCYHSADQQTAELSEPHNFYKKLCVWSVIWRTISFILIRICVSLINIFVVTQRSLKFSLNSSHDSLFTSECKQSKRFKIVLGWSCSSLNILPREVSKWSLHCLFLYLQNLPGEGLHHDGHSSQKRPRK